MTPNTYDVGDLITLTCRFYSDAAKTTPAAPSTVTLTIKDPQGAVAEHNVTPAAAATFDFTPLVGGMHEIRWEGTGSVQAAEQSQIYVRPVNA